MILSDTFRMESKIKVEENSMLKINQNINSSKLKHSTTKFNKKQDNSCLNSPDDLLVKLNENTASTSNSTSSFNPLMYSFVTFEGKLNFNYLQFCQDNKLINWKFNHSIKNRFFFWPSPIRKF